MTFTQEEFAEKAAWKKEMNEPCYIFRKFMISEPWPDDNSKAGGAAGRAAANKATFSG